jgi:subtilisin-like proprotein convertase family protein
MRQFCTILLLLGLIPTLSAQSNAPNFWTSVPSEMTARVVFDDLSQSPKIFTLDHAALKAALLSAPLEGSAAARQQPLLLQLPKADGSVQQFRVWESPTIAPGLAAKYPEIRNYRGVATDGSNTRVRLGLSYKGFHAFYFQQGQSIQHVEALPSEDYTTAAYRVYRFADVLRDPAAHPTCGVTGDMQHDHLEEHDFQHLSPAASERSDVYNLRKYRLSVSTTAEYSQFQGGTKPLVLSAIVQTMDVVGEIQERDYGVRLELIANNDQLIYLDAATDPYSGASVGGWAGQNSIPTNAAIGSENYDIGHVFGRFLQGGTVGISLGLGTVCNLNKAAAASNFFTNSFATFYRIVAHEMGHQMAAAHSWSNCPPNQEQLAPGTAFEPGSGTTLMSYANACGDQDVQGSEEDYFHVGSINQMLNFTRFVTVPSSTCGVVDVPVNNTPPSVSIPLPTNNFFIPISTPFELDCFAADADGDPMTYCWEQIDLGPTSSLGNPTGTAPSFRSFFPVSNSSRTFPRLQNILSNTSSDAEVLPTYSRQLTFAVTVRDNHPGGGAVAIDTVRFRATNTAGPFRVTFPDEFLNWGVGENQIVTWNVANTDNANVNCQKVNIRLSTNGGQTYPITLASEVPNSGRACVQVPNNITGSARIRVEAADNIFFDVSNANFSIGQPAAPGFTVCSELKDLVCLPDNYTSTISTSSAQGFNTPITLAASGLPAGAVATFSPNPVAPGSSSTMTIDFADNQPEASFTATITGTAGATERSYDVNLTVVSNNFDALTAQSPADGASGVNTSPVLNWVDVADADTYQIQLATDPSFATGTIVLTQNNIVPDTFDIPIGLQEGQAYFWRVRPQNECGTGDWAGPFVFMVQVQSCATFSATDLPKNISANGTPTVESKITIPAGGAISDVNVTKVQGNHDFMGDLDVQVISPNGTAVLLFKNRCSSYSGSFNFGFDDVLPGPFPCPPATNGTLFKPAGTLSSFNGQTATGEWILRVKDQAVSSGGQLQAFQLEICSNVSLSGPYIVNNMPLTLTGGTNAVIPTALLKTEDADNTAAELTYTLVTIPAYGALEYDWTGPMSVGAKFTQADIDAGRIRYFEYGWSTTGSDDFRFIVTDGEGGLVGGTFLINTIVGADEPTAIPSFGLMPNPASDLVQLAFSQALESDTRVAVFNTAGQLVRELQLAAGAFALQIPVSDLPQGLYSVLVSNKQGTAARKFVRGKI